MNELRQDVTTKEWVIYSTDRGERPHQFKDKTERKASLPIKDSNCPFCPGNEKMLLGVDKEFRLEGKRRWQIRVVPNKYPALLEGIDFEQRSKDMYPVANGFGRHEVIVESPYHNTDIPDMSREQVALLIEAYHSRYVTLLSNQHILMVTVFRNHGPKAGTSLIHPHSQIIASPIIPFHIRVKEMEAQRHLDDWGRCIFCDILNFERKEKERIILENDSFLCFVPFVASVPFEIWIVPKKHQSNFSVISRNEKIGLARALQTLISSVRKNLGDIDYNYVIHSFSRNKTNEPHLHWFLQIQPRITTKAGFEIGSGIRINPYMPEDNAKLLKDGLR